jgi:regulator of sigma E protease
MLEIIAIVFWGLLLLMLIVFVHELGHFLTARMFGVRVKEFMLGLPGPSVGFDFRGTRFGVTCIPLGGYARIAGMEGGEENPNLDRALAYLAYFGRLTLAEAQRSSKSLGFDLEEALDVLDEWGTVVRSKSAEHVCVYEMPAVPAAKPAATTPRAAAATTTRTAAAAKPAGPAAQAALVAQATRSTAAYGQGEPRPLPDAKAAIAAERAQTYRKLKWWQRMVVLAAGAGFNLILAIIVLTSVIVYSGQSVPTNTVESVLADSPAAAAGMQAGDNLVSLNGERIEDWQSFLTSIRALSPGDEVSVGYSRDGVERLATLKLATNDSGQPIIGVTSALERRDVPVGDALMTSVSFIGFVAQAIVQLFNPATFQQTVAQSSSVVGVSVEAANAAAQGLMPFMVLMAALSISIGLMNLLPIPPLDGGKMVVETIQRIIRRPVPARVVNYISMAGMALLLLLFFVCTTQDVQRYFLGG